MKTTTPFRAGKQLIFVAAFLLIALLDSCTSDADGGSENNSDLPAKELTFEQRAYNQITGALSIPSTEKFTWKTYRANMNGDNFEDAVIAINREAYAKARASQGSGTNAIVETGYFGNYNYFIFYDGKQDKFSVPIAVASSALVPLKIEFENIISDSYKDLTIEYKMSNSAYKSYYTLTGPTLQQVFEIKMYDFIGSDNPEVYFFEYDKGSISYAKDILVYEGEIKDYSPSKKLSQYEPVIQKKAKAKLVYRWFYNPQIAKYMTDPSKVNK